MANRVLSLHQGTRRVADSAVYICTLTVETNGIQKVVFLQGLLEELKDKLAICNPMQDLVGNKLGRVDDDLWMIDGV